MKKKFRDRRKYFRALDRTIMNYLIDTLDFSAPEFTEAREVTDVGAWLKSLLEADK
jgi:hypothetical protein